MRVTKGVCPCSIAVASLLFERQQWQRSWTTRSALTISRKAPTAPPLNLSLAFAWKDWE
jgi:hypothetical protein